MTVTVGLTACGGGGSDDPAMHSISYTENDNYRDIDLSAEGQTGSDILFDVESESVFYEIGEVSYNGTPITKGSLGYKFTMPDADVTIEIDLTPVTEYDDPDDYLSWGSSVIDYISVASDTDKEVSRDVTQDIPLSFDMAEFGSYNTEIDAEFDSSDESVIPVDALSFVEVTGDYDNLICGGKIVVDLKQINPGTASIYFSFDSNNAYEAELIRTFTVTEFGDIEVDTWDVAFTVDNNTDFKDSENIEIRFTDNNYIYGSTAQQSQIFTLSELTNGEGTLVFTVGHTYSISASYAVWIEEEGRYDPDTMATLSINDYVIEGSSTTGFNQIIDGKLTLVSRPTKTVAITLND